MSMTNTPSTTTPMPRWPAALVFEDGSIFHGVGFGRCCESIAEIVFNTSLTGYQEIVSEPSYAGQIVVMTASQIGNVGCNPSDSEACQRCITVANGAVRSGNAGVNVGTLWLKLQRFEETRMRTYRVAQRQCRSALAKQNISEQGAAQRGRVTARQCTRLVEHVGCQRRCVFAQRQLAQRKVCNRRRLGCTSRRRFAVGHRALQVPPSFFGLGMISDECFAERGASVPISAVFGHRFAQLADRFVELTFAPPRNAQAAIRVR